MEHIFVVVPVYKADAYLDRCIQSILNQTCTNWELVLVDDGSPDNCPAICDRYAAEYDNITVIHQENGGLSAARNAGIEYALKHGNPKTDWINFIDSDDFVHPKYLEYLYRAAKNAGADISSCGFSRTSESIITPVQAADLTCDCLSPEAYWCRNYTNANAAWGKLYRLFLFEDIRYPVGKIFEDNFTTYKLMYQYSEIPVIESELYYWYIAPNSITMSEWTPKRIDQIDAAEEQLMFFRENRYKAAARRSARYMLWGCEKALKYIHRLSPKYDNLLTEMEARQKKAFRVYAEEVGWITAAGYWLMVRYIAPAFRRTKRKIKKLIAAR